MARARRVVFTTTARAAASIGIPVPHEHATTDQSCATRTETNPIMVTSPKDNDQKMQPMLNAWEKLAPDKSFGGMTLA